MLTLARERKGFTQSELAEMVGISQSLISKYELGVKEPTDAVLETMASKLDVLPSFFDLPDKRYPFGSSCTYHRRQQSLQAGQLAKLLANVNTLRVHVGQLSRSIEIESDTAVPRLDIEDYEGDIREIASVARKAMRVPKGPVTNLTKTLESAGVVVYRKQFETRKLDAISQWIPPLPPVFMVNEDAPVDRQRFTLAHELGHLVMHQSPTDDMEAQADRFAAEFLMPVEDIRRDLEGLRADRLHSLKLSWRVSMAALIRRARDLDCITDAQYTAMNKMLSVKGYRKGEPPILWPEEPSLYRNLLEIHMTELGYSAQELSDLLHITGDEMFRCYGVGRPKLQVVTGGSRSIA